MRRLVSFALAVGLAAVAAPAAQQRPSNSPRVRERRCSGFQKISKPEGSMQCKSRSFVLNQMSEIWMSPLFAPACFRRSWNSGEGGGGSVGFEMSVGP